MCGITGIYCFSESGKQKIELLENSITTLSKRGPDGNGIYKTPKIGLGHSRLAIIDTSEAANQPFTDHSGRFTLTFNGEIFNFKELKQELLNDQIVFKSNSDTEVLLYLYIKEKEKCLNKLNGFFSFAVYDHLEDKLFIARDRYGIKPLLIYQDEDNFIFASEMKALMAFDIKKEIDFASLNLYLQLNYIPSPNSIFKGVKKLRPGRFIEISNNKVKETPYYLIPKNWENSSTIIDYEVAKKTLFNLCEDAVKQRLVSDVPIGTFLSGGIDSSITTAIASKYHKNINSFSIGYADEPLFDETKYAQLVAKMHGTNHTVFSLRNKDLYDNLYHLLDYMDEPFADSSALAVYILSQQTRKKVTVALSGDGADELFGGYNKHMAEYKAREKGLKSLLVKSADPLWKLLPKSRNSFFGNKARQLEKFSEGLLLSNKDRYWRWASILSEKESSSFLLNTNPSQEILELKKSILTNITEKGDFNEALYTDMELVLQNDMLTKVDMMSMANSLEVRVPFLDYRIVDFAFSIPAHFKVDGKIKKKILQDTFRSILPAELYNRPKHGFEVPLLKWFRSELKSLINEDLLADAFIKEQNLFHPEAIKSLKNKLFSNSPGDAVATVWALIVFQHWWKKTMI